MWNSFRRIKFERAELRQHQAVVVTLVYANQVSGLTISMVRNWWFVWWHVLCGSAHVICLIYVICLWNDITLICLWNNMTMICLWKKYDNNMIMEWYDYDMFMKWYDYDMVMIWYVWYVYKIIWLWNIGDMLC